MTVVPTCSDLAWLGIRAWTGPFTHSANLLFRIILVTHSGSEGMSKLSCGLPCLHLFLSLLTCYFSRQEMGQAHPYLQPSLIWTVLGDSLEWNGWSGILEASYKVLAGTILVFWEKPGHVRIPPHHPSDVPTCLLICLMCDSLVLAIIWWQLCMRPQVRLC